MAHYKISVRAKVRHRSLTKHADRQNYLNIVGNHRYEANSEDEALDAFHKMVPIAMLEDFTITCSEVRSLWRIPTTTL